MFRLLWVLMSVALLSIYPMHGDEPPLKEAVNSSWSLEEASQETEAVKTQLLSEHKTIKPGESFWLALHVNVKEDWHIYWKNPGDSGMPFSINWELPEGIQLEKIDWPYPQRFKQDEVYGFGYGETVTFLAKFNTNEQLALKEHTLTANLKWVMCSSSNCVPGFQDLSITLPAKDQVSSYTEHKQLFAQARDKIPETKWEASGFRKDGFIYVQIKHPSKSGKKYETALFFPEKGDMVDHTIDPVLTSGESNEYALILKDKEEETSSNLKGVVVLKANTVTPSQQAVEINIPLNNTSEPIASSQIITNLNPTISHNNELENNFLLALVFAFVGGMILNLMPCVLPVMSFKVMGFVKMSGEDRKTTFLHGVIFSLGVLISFWALASVLLILQAYGSSVGWGFQLQEPIFVGALATLLFVMGLNLFGVFEMGTSVMAAAGGINANRSGAFTQSFLSGVLATVVATPCTGPFLGSAVGYALTLPPIGSLSIFTFLGLGMSFPYLLLAGVPSLLKFMPKPGAWMVIFKEAMGFLMMATVIWLVWVFSAQTTLLSSIVLLCAFFIIAVGCWVYGKWGHSSLKKMTKIAVKGILAFCMVTGGTLIYQASQGVEVERVVSTQEDWEPFSPERVAELRKQGIPVFIDFTAKWCLICQTNHMVFNKKDVSDKFAEKKVVKMKADWTRNDPVITAELKKHGRSGVPLYVLYEGMEDSQPLVLPQVLTADTVIQHLDDMKEKKV
ncbi:Thiol:disulfide interchange protein DsbD precursor [Candidatus Rubidus massiliensis]|nr:Thiol:disulfide interchange protein DsbD precursor [Candidatus Rubidus massiliensis]